MKKSSFWERVNWKITLFLLLTPVVGIVGAIFLAITHQLHTATIFLALGWMVATALAITAGYHRLFSHNTYSAHPVVRIFFLLLGAAAFEGSTLEWCTDHRNHHRYSETEKDPYNIKKGFWYAHMGWLMVLDPSKRNYSNVDDLAQDKWIVWQHRYFAQVALVVGFILPALVASLWGDWLGGFLLAGVLRVALNHHVTFCINSVCHVFGKRLYSLEQTGRDNWVTALFTYGEGFHNFHHQFPSDYRNGIRIYHYDPTKWLIWLLGKLRLARDLKIISATHLMRYRLKTDEKILKTKFKQGSEALVTYVQEHLEPLRQRILQLLAQIEKIEKTGKIKEYRNQLKVAHSELKRSLWIWGRLTKG